MSEHIINLLVEQCMTFNQVTGNVDAVVTCVKTVTQNVSECADVMSSKLLRFVKLKTR